METCRSCLNQRKNMHNIFQTHTKLSYADMLKAVASVRINLGDGYTEKICGPCRRRLKEAYEFKLLTEVSDKRLRNEEITDEKSNQRIINFDDLNDIKIKIELKLENDATCYNDPAKSSELYYISDSKEALIGNTTIKKLNTFTEHYDVDIKDSSQIHVEEFLKLNRIKDETDNNDCDFQEDYFDDFQSNDNDHEYLPQYSKRKFYEKSKHSLKKKKLKTLKGQKKVNGSTVKIKPIVLNDIRLVPTKPRQLKPRGPRKYKKVVEKKSVCPYCGKVSKSLNVHLLIHTGEKSFKCDQCPKSYYNNGQLQCHKRSHSEVKEFQCDKCPSGFYQKALLRSHLLTHDNIRNHLCNVCNKGFKRKSALRRHTVRHSSANKNVMCELCNMSFFEKSQLRHHMRVHTGERPYNCEICSQPYSYKHDFNRHCFKKHGVFLKRRSINVMNEEVLIRERVLMKEMLLKTQQSNENDGEIINPFTGPQAALAYTQTIQAINMRQIPVDF